MLILCYRVVCYNLSNDAKKLIISPIGFTRPQTETEIDTCGTLDEAAAKTEMKKQTDEEKNEQNKDRTRKKNKKKIT